MERKFKVVRLDINGRQSVTKEDIEELAKVKAELTGVDCATEDEIIEAARDADIIVTMLSMRTRITERAIRELTKCQAIIGGSVGFDKIDIDAATANNIIVVNHPSPEWCVEEVSNHAIVLLLACAKKLVRLDSLTKQGRWGEAKGAQAPMGTIHEQTLGLVGCGSIGRMTAMKAKCFNLKVLGYDPYVKKSLAAKSGITLVSLSELLKESDYVSAHPLLSEETRHMIGEKEFRQMKPDAYLINTSRGPVVDEAALVKALQQKWIAGAGLDVFEKEPIEPDSPLLKMDNVVVTPHCASYSDFAFTRPRIAMLEGAIRVLSGQWPRNVVNKTVKPKIHLVKGK